MHVLYYFALVLLAGIFMAKVTRKLRLPNVTGYILAGIVIGPSLGKLIPKEVVSSFFIVSEVALGFIAYSIGSEFNLKHIRKIGLSVVWITLMESLCAVFAVTLAMIFVFHQPLHFSLVLGSIAAATAPAATILVIRQYKAKGVLVDTLLPVVAMDDAVAILAFGVAVAFAESLVSNNSAIPMASVVLRVFNEVFFSLLLGLVLGLFLSFMSGRVKGEDALLSLTIGCIFLGIGLASKFGLSSLFVAMMIGAVVSNLVYSCDRVLSVVDRFTPPIFLAFFTISGADLQLGMLPKVGLIGVGYVVFRVIGKILGAYAGARMTNSPPTVQKYLGLTLVPQAGVAIGLSLLAEQTLPGMGVALRNIILGSTVIYELFGPVIAKQALVMAGEIKEA